MANKNLKAAGEQAQLVPNAAPPPYSELPAQNGASSSRGQPQLGVAPQQPDPHHQRYPSGPTAFSALPPPGPALHARADSQYAYLSARAAARQADRRAARRLCGAVVWAVVLWTIMGAILGGVIGGEVARRSEHGRSRWEEGRYAVAKLRKNFKIRKSGNATTATPVIAEYATI
ncbi:hypothetical protein BMF94_7091 [Rhodotorula taiwanensis]|uniref:Uncharacterized protein n=1 Tax=Rhodotorula taiwanensis TaxID=741276 RepID=A0A2S5AZT4_9BASI|nr:hypothetical protein BMF94_7091 [Rhodotorula taiwanensis]